MCARIVAWQVAGSGSMIGGRIAEALGGTSDEHPAKLISDLAAMCPGVVREHQEAGVDMDALRECVGGWNLDRLNGLTSNTFKDLEDVFGVLTKPLGELCGA
jgi:hypothetical protein